MHLNFECLHKKVFIQKGLNLLAFISDLPEIRFISLKHLGLNLSRFFLCLRVNLHVAKPFFAR